ncbi:hypothetical protein ACFLTM_01450, partial [Candidatus Bipolaricaulota bacterium]
CRFRGWTVNGQPMAGNPITFVMNEDKTAVAGCGSFFDDVESGPNGWTATGLWGISEQACCPLPMPSPTHAWCYGGPGLGGAGVLTSPVIDVSGVTSTEVGFWYCLDLLGFRSWANAQTEVSIDGGAWQSVWTTTGAQRGAWTQVGPIEVPIPPGSTELRLRYNVTSASGSGCFCIDDIAVSPLSGVGGLAYDALTESFSEFRVDSVSNIPNPVTDIHTTRFEVKGVGIDEIRVMIYDQNGRLVFDSDWQPNGYNWHIETNDGETLANGVYLYKVMVRGVNAHVIVTETEKLAVYR